MATVAQKQAPAPAQNLPKALRVGVIQGGKIVEERLVRKMQTISVGQSNKNLFVVPSAAMPRTFALFEVHNNRYLLNFTEQMDGRVAVGEQPVPLAQLRDGQRAVRRGNLWSLPLPDKSRGKVSIGDVTFLFQFITAPPVAARPQLPPSIRGSLLDRIDLFLTCILGASFLFHLVMLGILSSIHVPDHPDPSVIPDYVQEIIIPPEAKKEPVKVADNGPMAPQPKAKPSRPTNGPSKADTGTNKPVDPVEEAKREAARVASQTAQARNYGVLGAFGAVDANNPDAVASSSAGGPIDLNNVMKKVGGVQTGGQGGPGGILGSKVAGTQQGGLASIGKLNVGSPNSVNATGARTQDTSAAATHIGTGSLQMDQSTAGPLTQRLVDSEIHHLLGAVQSCYARELKSAPGMTHVKIKIDFTIGTHGTVTDTSVDSDDGGDGALENCIQSVIKGSARFAPPPPSPVDVTYPFILSGG